MKYSIVETEDYDSPFKAAEALANKVCDYLQLGWMPQGGVCVMHCLVDRSRFAGEDSYMAFQAVTHDGDGPLPE